MVALVYGVGINDRSIPSNINGKPTKEYSLWTSMLRRVYSTAALIGNPTYVGCSVSENFLNYRYFHEWCQKQIGFNVEGYSLDKDLLINGNKTYNEITCVFLPKILNTLIIKCNASRGILPIGVSAVGNRFKSQYRILGTKKHIGTFDTLELAFQAYKTFKEAYIKEQAELYKDSIDPRAYLALLNYEVSIDD